MNREQLAKALADRASLPIEQALAVIDALFDSESGLVVESLGKGVRIDVPGYGSFAFDSARVVHRRTESLRDGSGSTVTELEVDDETQASLSLGKRRQLLAG